MYFLHRLSRLTASFFGAILPLASMVAAEAAPAAVAADPLTAGFLAPPPETRPGTFWLWMNGNVTRDGITRDLEAMQRVGIGSVMMFDGSTYLPAGPVGYLNPLWRELMLHALREGKRLGITVGMHNGPGWSSSGGPWIEPEQSMQQLVWTEVTVAGGRHLELDLPTPHTKLGFYQDARVLAFPALASERRPYAEAMATATAGGRAVAAAGLHDGKLDTVVDLQADEPLVMTLAEPVQLHGVMGRSTEQARFPALRVEVSADGHTFTEITTLTSGGHHGIIAPSVRTFDPVTARVVRFVPRSAGAVAELELYRAPRLPDWPAKANFDYRVAGALTLPSAVPADACIDPARVVDLTGHMQAGTLRWQAPPGDWTILRLGHTSTGKTNVAASAAGTGLESDKFSAAVTAYHFNHVIGQVEADAAAAGLPGPATVTIDSYEAGLQNWSRDFPEAFAQRTGYPLWPYAPALVGRIVGDAGRTERFLFDVRRVQAELMAENYYGKMHALANARGMRFFVEGYGPGMFDELRISGLPDVPMTEFWTRTPWTPNRTVKMVTSAAHVYGKPVIGAEAFTGEAQTSRWLDYPYSLKTLGDEMFAAGVNQLVFHRYAHQPHPDAVPGMTMGPWGFHFDRTNTWFEQSAGWLDYLQRTQFLLRQGTYVADVLYFTGERSPDSTQYRIPVLPAGYTYDLVNADVLLRRVRVEAGDFVLPEGGRYRILALPANLRAMTPELVRRLGAFAEAGGMIVGPQPQFSPTLMGFPESEAAMVQEAQAIWRRDNVRAHQKIAEALHQKGIAPDLTLLAARRDASIAWQHRKLADGGDLYFVANRQRRVEELVLSLRDMAGREPEIWRPEPATLSRAPVYWVDESRVELPLRLEPAESVFVLFRHPVSAQPADGLTLDGRPLLGPKAIAAGPSDAANSFTMAMWVKPDTDLRVMPKEATSGRVDEVGKFYAIPADPGDLRFGAGHATAGLAVGRNGIYVIERSSEQAPAVLVWEHPVAGWTHVAVTYRDGTPELYVDGELVRRGLRSGSIVHPGVGAPPPPVDYTLHFRGIEAITRAAGELPPPSRGQVFVFEGNFAPAQVFATPLRPEQVTALVARGVPPPEAPVFSELDRASEGGATLLAWRSGNYALGKAPGRAVQVPAVETLAGPWQVRFPPGRGAPESVVLPELRSWHEHDDGGVKYFSGTATYEQIWTLPAPLEPARRVVLDLGRVEVVAEVTVNGKRAGLLWKEPYRLDITDQVQPGRNHLEIAVTNLWTNRLIGDERLPEEDAFGLHDERGEDPFGITELPEWYLQGKPKPPGGRTTFATWRFYTPDEPLVASGLLGPVRIWQPVRLTLPPPAPE